MKTTSFLSLAALSLFLSACGQPEQGPATAGDQPISDGRLVLPAVSGNPGAAYFAVKNDGVEPASLAGVSVEGATKAEMHETTGNSMNPLATVTLGPGATATFAPGEKHVMVFGVSPSLKPGDTAKLTLFFSGGKTVSGPLRVEAAGGEAAEMSH